MGNFDDITIKVRDYKCIGSTPEGFDLIKPVNLIIGRNNSGKSTLLDIIGESIHQTSSFGSLGYKQRQPALVLSKCLSESDVKKVFREGVGGGGISGDHWRFGKQLVNGPITWEEFGSGTPSDRKLVAVGPPMDQLPTEISQKYGMELVQSIQWPITNLQFRRLRADRDIRPESEGDQINVQEDGRYLTTTFVKYINSSGLPSDLIEKQFLEELNRIVSPELLCKRIIVQKHDNGEWEVFLEEEEKGPVPLTHTGSGLKTIILTLAFLIILPKSNDKPLSNYVFGFEKLENNLHPAMLRRLLSYIRQKAEKEKCTFFITTHSSVVIDVFSTDPLAQIIHVTHDNTSSTVRAVQTYIDNRGILDDLDIRASDLLQSNGVVWVEGPSDRIYFNRWVQLFTGGKIREGTHYQCVFYGGRLLAHLSATSPEVELDNMVKIFRVNRNAIILFDSDLRTQDGELGATKTRVINEISEVGGYAWVTDGKEIENYIPMSALKEKYPGGPITTLKKNQNFPEYLNKLKSKEGDRFKRNKVLVAEEICPFIDLEGLKSTLDLNMRLEEVIRIIKRWNGLES